MEQCLQSDFYFQLSTGNLLANKAKVQAVQAGEAPRNLRQLLALGKLLVKSEATQELVEAGEGPDVVPLHQLLVDKTRIITVSAYEALDVDDWELEDY